MRSRRALLAAATAPAALLALHNPAAAGVARHTDRHSDHHHHAPHLLDGEIWTVCLGTSHHDHDG